MKEVTIVCDGSSIGNGKRSARAAAAAILEYRGQLKIVGEYIGDGTNQQAEIIAACVGLEALTESCLVKIVTDSQYVVKTMKGLFKRKTNLEFWQRLDLAASTHEVTWSWTRGHAGHPIQEKCDEAARTIASSGRIDRELLNSILIDQKSGLKD
ncbi:MAG: ribonuclease HI [Acidobacteria bacterium]|nr:ribonuclease HI [Acidobacteriota bacterium]